MTVYARAHGNASLRLEKLPHRRFLSARLTLPTTIRTNGTTKSLNNLTNFCQNGPWHMNNIFYPFGNKPNLTPCDTHCRQGRALAHMNLVLSSARNSEIERLRERTYTTRETNYNIHMEFTVFTSAIRLGVQ